MTRLKQHWQAILATFFPTWKAGKQWRCTTQTRRTAQGHCIEWRIIEIGVVSKDDDKLDLLLIHEIAHAVASLGHGKTWQRRIACAAVVSRRLGRHRLAELLDGAGEQGSAASWFPRMGYTSQLGNGRRYQGNPAKEAVAETQASRSADRFHCRGLASLKKKNIVTMKKNETLTLYRTEEQMNKVFLLNEVAKLFKMRPHQVAYAISSGLVPEPKLRIGNKRIFQADDIKRLAVHFGKEATCPSF